MTLTAIAEDQVPAADAAPVRVSDLTRELGIPVHVRREIIGQGLIKPVQPVRRGRPTCVHADEAERIRRAFRAAAIAGVSIVIVLKIIDALSP
jgi:hypothetical protein